MNTSQYFLRQVEELRPGQTEGLTSEGSTVWGWADTNQQLYLSHAQSQTLAITTSPLRFCLKPSSELLATLEIPITPTDSLHAGALPLWLKLAEPPR